MAVNVQISVSNEHYQYLKQRAERIGATLDALLSEIIEAEIVWQQMLASDPIQSLIGQIGDDFETQQIDDVVYGLKV